MKKVCKMIEKLIGCAAIGLAMFAIASCGENSGLGASVDTEAPTLSIEYPESGAAIRDTFILYGTCSDDKAVQKVTGSIKSVGKNETDSTYVNEPFEATLGSAGKDWSVELNAKTDSALYNGWKYPDGTYEVSVTAYDNAGHESGKYSRTFEIDNTPPVFIISNPGVVKSSGLDASAYGSIFTIDGTISDNHSIALMDVKIYNASGDLVSSETYEGEQIEAFRVEEVATAGGTSVQIAQYAKQDSSTQNQTSLTTENVRYSTLHPNDSGTEYYYAQITLTDSTKVYKNPPTENASRSVEELSADSLGNSTSKLYLYDDVYTTLMSAKKGLGLSAANLKDILAGVETNGTALETLTAKVIDTSASSDSDALANKLYFSLNPEANPTYIVNGFSFFTSDGTVQTASTGNTVSVTIAAGLDGTNIAPSGSEDEKNGLENLGAVRVWMKSYNAKPASESSLKTELRSLESKVEALEKDGAEFVDKINKKDNQTVTTVNVVSGENDWILIYDYSLNNSKGSSVTTKTFSVTLPDGIELSKYYILGVTGYDLEDVEFAQNTVYGFEGNTAGVPPTITFDSPASLSIWGEFASPVFSGAATLSSNSLYITELSATILVTDENSNETVGTYTDTIKCEIRNEEKIWSESERGAITFDSATNKWTVTPSKFTDLISKYDSEKDDGMYWLSTLTVSGKSSSGHEGEASRSIHIDTVKPVAEISSVTPSVSGAEYFDENDTNTYLNGEIAFKANIEEQNLLDEDAKNSVYPVWYDIWASTDLSKTLSADDSILSRLEMSGNLGKTYSVNEKIDTRKITEIFKTDSDSDPKIQVEIVVYAKDKAGNIGSYSSKTLEDGKNYVVYQETDRPKITLGNANPELKLPENKADLSTENNVFGTTSNNKLQISFSDDDLVNTISVTLYDENGEKLADSLVAEHALNPYSVNPKKTTYSLNYTLPSEEGVYMVKIEADDDNVISTQLNDSGNSVNHATVDKFFVAVDSGAPDIEINSPSAGSYESSPVTLKVTLSKNVTPKATLYKQKDDATYDEISDFAEKTAVSGSTGVYKWEGTATVSDDGTYKLEVSAEDSYGQKASKERVFYIDKNAPTITGTSATPASVYLDTTAYTSLVSTITDEPAGVNVAKYFLSKEKVTKTNDEWKTAFNDGGDAWGQMNKGATNYNASVDVQKFQSTDGKVYVYVAALDNAGNLAVSDAVELTLDATAPSIKVEGFDGSTTISNNGTSTTTDSSKTFNVVVTDTNVAKLESSNSSVSVGTASDVTGGKSYPITVTWTAVTVETDKYEDSKTVTFTATDQNNRKATHTVTLSCDNYEPRVTVNTYKAQYNVASFALAGTIDDANLVTLGTNLTVALVPTDSDSAGSVVNGSISFGTQTGSSCTWTAAFSGVNEKIYNVAIVATDSFGNISYYSTDSTKTTSVTGTGNTVTPLTGGTITVDTHAPESTFTLTTATNVSKVLDSKRAEMTGTSSVYTLAAGKTHYTDGTFTLGGTITEGNLVTTGDKKPKLTVSKDNVTASEVTITLGTTTNGETSWTYTPNYAKDGTADGEYSYTLTLYDTAENEFSNSVNVILDTKNPTLDFTSPTEGESFESTPSAKIAYSDDGVGIDTNKITYTVLNITESETGTAVTDFTKINGSSTGTVTFGDNFTSEGSFKITAKVKDYLGHESSEVTRTFYFDKSKPSVTETVVGESGVTTNGGEGKTITLSGTVSDTNGLYNNGAADSDGKTAITISAIVGEKETSWNIPVTTSDKKTGTWTKTFKVGSDNSSDENYLPDGSYTFAIVATDVASKTTQISRTVRIDTVEPTLDSSKITQTPTKDSSNNEWYNTNDLHFSGTASDSGTGIATVQYQTSADGTTWTDSQYFAGTTSWSGTISSIVSGTTKIKIIVADNAGNTAESEVLGPYNIDTAAPELTESSVKAGFSSNSLEKAENYYVNGENDIYLSFKAADTGSGIKAVYVNPYTKITDTTATGLLPATAGEENAYTVTIGKSTLTKSGTVYARIYDYAGNYSDVNLVSLTFDNTVPKVESASLADSSEYTAYKPNQSEEKYYVNNTNGNFTLSGIATDNLGIASVKLDIASAADTTKTISIEETTDVSNWSFNIADKMKDWTAVTGATTTDATATITVTDKAGNTATKTVEIVFDTIAPTGIHDITTDKKGKDLYFRIGEDGSEGKYAPGTYGNTLTIKVRGYFEEEGSGTKYIYYKVFNGTIPTDDQVNAFKTGYATDSENVGYFEPLSTIETKDVSYNSDENGTKATKSGIKTSFKSNISGLAVGNNYVLLLAVDNVGNAKIDEGIAYTYTEGGTEKTISGCYSLNVDQTPPTLTSARSEETIITNGKFNAADDNDTSKETNTLFTFTGTATDTEAGIRDITITAGGQTISATKTTYGTIAWESANDASDANLQNWTLTLNKKFFNYVNATKISISAKVTDDAGTGNAETYNVASIDIDKTAPIVTLTTPSDADSETTGTQINGKITLSGKVTEKNLPENLSTYETEANGAAIEIQYVLSSAAAASDSDTGWTSLSNLSKDGMTDLALTLDSTFDITNFDTTKLTDGASYEIRAKVKDVAGNVGYSSPVTVQVLQDSDRPIVTISNLTALTGGSYAYILKNGTKSQLRAVVTDDDGIDTVVISGAAYTGSETKNGDTTGPTAIGEVVYTPANTEDGVKDIYIYVKDSAGKEFYMTADATTGSYQYLNMPKIKVGDTRVEDSTLYGGTTKYFEYFADSTQPLVGEIMGIAYNSSGTVNAGLNESTGKYTEAEKINASYIIGGTERSQVQFVIPASDESGIAGMTLEITYPNKDGGTTSAKYRSADTIGDDSSATVSGSLAADGDSTKDFIWTTGNISFTDLGTGNVTLKVVPYDKSDLAGNGNTAFVADMTGPTIKVTSPSTTEHVSGISIPVSGIATDVGGSSTSTIQWIVPKKGVDADEALTDWTGELANNATASAWKFNFEQGAYSLNDYTNDIYAGTKDSQGIWQIPIYFKATDSLGNYTIYKEFKIMYDPDADRPKTTISYPGETDRKLKAESTTEYETYAILGGTIRATGSVEIPDGSTSVWAVYMQIADESGSFTDGDKTRAENAKGGTSGIATPTGYGYTVIGAEALESTWKTENEKTNSLNFDNADVDNTTKKAAWWGIRVTKTSNSWSYSLNANSELNSYQDNATNNIKVRFCGVSVEGKVGRWTEPYEIHIDSNIPKYTTAMYRYATDPTSAQGFKEASPSKIKTYDPDMYLKGQWYAYAKITDESNVVIDGVKRGTTSLVLGEDYFVYPSAAQAKEVTNDGSKSYESYVWVKIDSSYTTTQTYTITARDSEGTPNYIYPAFELNTDNTAPTVTALTDGSDSAIAWTKLRNSDHGVSFKTAATDTGSGFDKLLFYFKRTADSKTTVELPLPAGTSGLWTNDSDSDKGAYVGELTETDSDLTNDGSENLLYGVTLTGTSVVSDGATTFTVASSTDISSYKFIRKGGVIKLSGIYYVITDVRENAITVGSTVSGEPKEAFAAAAMVLDHVSTAETWTWTNGTFKVAGDDDDDGFVEYIKKSGSTWTCEATIQGDQLDDGPVSLVTIAFDNAENVKTVSTDVMIANNTPRLTKVFLATDLNGDSKYSDSEFVQGSVYNYIEGSTTTGDEAVKSYQSALKSVVESNSAIVTVGALGDWKDKDGNETLTKKLFRVSDKTAVTFEFVSGYEGYGSGNNDVYAYMTVGSSALTSPDETATHKIETKLDSVSADTITWATAQAQKGIVLDSTLFYSNGAKNTYGTYKESTSSQDEPQYLTFTLWDSTKGTTLGMGDTVDSTTGKITQFGAQNTVVNIPVYFDFVDDQKPVVTVDSILPYINDEGKVLGHVEQTDTLPSNYFTVTGIGQKSELDQDPKLSGTVVIKGTAKDNKRISALTFKMAGGTNGEAIYFADTAQTIAEFTSGETVAKPITSAAWKVTVTNEKFSQENGHTYDWEINLPTTAVYKTGTDNWWTALDLKVELGITDSQNLSGANDELYVDVVPYITSITRTQTSKSVKDTTYRSTYGEYAVAVGDTLTVTGFNLGGTDNNYGAAPTAKVGSTNVTATEQTVNEVFEISGFTNSGELTFEVNGVVSLNDKNNNAVATNQEAESGSVEKSSTVEGNVLYDNRYLRVWDVGHYFANSVSANKPTMAVDTSGNLFSTWSLMGTASIQAQRTLSANNMPIYVCYDQPEKESWLGIDTKSDSAGGLSVIYFPANVGSSATPDSTGYADATTTGGVWGVGLQNDIAQGRIYYTKGQYKHLSINGNPYHALDSKVSTAGWQLSSASMRREIGQFSQPHTVRFGDGMHYVYYDSYNKALRYTYQAVDSNLQTAATQTDTNDQGNNTKHTDGYEGIISGWNLIDGKSDGQDRIHTLVWAEGGKTDFYTKDTKNIEEVNGYSIKMTHSWNPAVGNHIGISYQDSSAVFRIELHKITNVSTSNEVHTITWNDYAYDYENNTPSGITIYRGDSNVVADYDTGLGAINAAGLYAGLDVTKEGRPVIVYYDMDNMTLRVAYSSSTAPDMLSTDGVKSWTRQTLKGIVSGGTYVQAKIDGNNYLHILYRDNKGALKYIKSRNAPDGAEYEFSKDDVMTVDTAGTYGTLSIIRSGSDGAYTYTPCVSFLNSEGTANGVKYAVLRTVDQGATATSDGTTAASNGVVATASLWDVHIVPAVSGNYVVGGEYIYTEGYNGWTVTDDTVSTAECDAIIGYNTGRMDVLFLKSKQ